MTDFTKPVIVEEDDIHALTLYFSWGQDTVGWGQCNVWEENGDLYADTEGMGREWLRRALHILADTIADKVKIEGEPVDTRK